MDRKVTDNLLIRKILVVFFALVGFLTTIKLAMIYYDANFNPYALPSFCSVNSFIDCDGVAKTTESQFLGIPLAYWGMFLYLFIIFLVFVDKLKNIKFLHFLHVFKHPMSYISSLGYIAFVISMTLAGISIFEIKKLCILCLFTYFLNLFIAIAATDFHTGIFVNFKISIRDFLRAIKIKKYLIAFIAFVVVASAFLAYTSLSYCFTPQIKRIKSIKEFAKMKPNQFEVEGNILGDKDAKLIVNIYSDYACPICYAENLMLYRIVEELNGVKIVHHNLPLDAECNPSVRTTFHVNSCKMAKYSSAAKLQGRFWEMNSALFEKQPKTEDEILNLAKSMNFNIKKLKEDANSFATNQAIVDEIKGALDLGIDGTPTLVINGKVYPGVKPYYELKDILIKAGAVEKK